MAFIRMDSQDFFKRKQVIQLNINLQTEIAGDHITDLWEEKSFPYVPRREGYLEGSYTKTLKSYAPRLLITAMYSALSNRGFDYALIQHEVPFSHPRKGEVRYFGKGIDKVNVLNIWGSRIRTVF